LRGSRRFPATKTLTFDSRRVRGLHNIIEPERNPAGHYHTMGQSVPSGRVAGGKKTLPLAFVNFDNALTARAQANHIFLSKYTGVIITYSMCCLRRLLVGKGLAAVHRIPAIMSDDSLTDKRLKNGASQDFELLTRYFLRTFPNVFCFTAVSNVNSNLFFTIVNKQSLFESIGD
jgi:hypothetical protein